MTVSQQHREGGSEELIGGLRRQVDLYRDLQRLARRQRELIVREEPQALLSLLAERQKVVDELTSLTRTMAPRLRGGGGDDIPLAAADRREAKELIETAAALLREVLAADRHDSGLLASRKAHTATEIAAVRSRKDVFRAYGGHRPAQRGAAVGTDESA